MLTMKAKHISRSLISLCIVSTLLLEYIAAIELEILVSPEDPRVIAGTKVTMMCSSDRQIDEFYVQMNDQPWHMSGSYTLTVDYSKSDTLWNCCGKYDLVLGGYCNPACHVSRTECGNHHHHLIVIPETPTISQTFTFQGVSDTVTLTCKDMSLIATPAISYKFMHDSKEIYHGTANEYTFSATATSSGSYTCIVLAGNEASSQSPGVTIHVSPSTVTAPAPTRRPIPFHCEKGPSAVTDYQYIYDPAQYIHCETDGKAYIETCPVGTIWNQAARKCAAPSPSIG